LTIFALFCSNWAIIDSKMHDKKSNIGTRELALFQSFLLMCVLCLFPVFTLHAANGSSTKLSGTVIGTKLCYDYSKSAQSTTVNTPANAFDGNLATFVATANSSNGWVGLDLGTPHVITRVGWSPRNASVGPERVVLSLFEGANDPDFLDAVPLYLIDTKGTIGVMSYVDVKVSRGFRYVRYCGPSSSRCNIAEVEFYGYEGAGDDSQFYQITNLPTLSYHTLNGKEPASKTTELEAQMALVYEEGTLIQEYPILARIRGNASAGFPKKPYRIKFNDGKSHHIMKGGKLESPSKAKKWTLINNYGDKTLMRNILSFEVSRRLDILYTPYCQPVDVIVNGEYKGCYQLCDQITVDDERVPITEMDPTDIEGVALTGGYIVEIDAYAGNEKSMFTSNRGIPVTIKVPGEDEIVAAQATYIRKFFNEMEATLWSNNYTDPEKGYRSRLDVKSFLQHFIVGEYSGNIDTYWSVYMYKERMEDLFHVAPVWDFDLAWDNDGRVYPVNGKSNWVYCSGGSCASGMNSFVSRVLSDPYAQNLLERLWADLRDGGLLTKENFTAYIDSMAQVLEQSQRLNFLRWPILNQIVHQNPRTYGSYAGEVKAVKEYSEERIDWIDEKLGYGSFTPTEPGRYEIGTPQEMADFAKAVNKGDVRATAVLTADIDMQSVNDIFQPIGRANHLFAGSFDGQGHTISHLNIQSSNDYVGLFGMVTGGATVRNLTLDSTCSISGNAFVGLIGGSNGSGSVTMECLGNEGSVTATNQNAGGIIGCNMNSTATFLIDNCYVSGKVQGGRESAAITGWLGGNATLTNCYSVAEVSGNDAGSLFYRGTASLIANCYDLNGSSRISSLAREDVTSGALCYRMNGSRSEDVHWYQTIGADAHPVLSPEHAVVYKEGDTYNNGSLALQLRTPDDLLAFARVVNAGQGNIKATLLSDIDLEACNMVPVGSAEHPFKGTFEGNHHVIRHLRINHTSDGAGLFGHVSGGAVIRDLTLDENSVISGTDRCGMVGCVTGVGYVTLLNLGNEGVVEGSCNVAGILGFNESENTRLLLANCYMTGEVKGDTESAALCAGMGVEAEVKNCYNTGSVTGAESGKTFARYRLSPSFSNCYDTQNLQPRITQLKADKVASGELCYRLNGACQESPVFYQTLGADTHPVTTPRGWVIHQGIQYTNLMDYKIDTPDALAGFAMVVASGLNNANAVLTSDIDMLETQFQPIGSAVLPFQGCFNGQGHRISNFSISGEEFVGLFGMVADGADISHLVIDSSCTVKGTSAVGGIVGGSDGTGTILLTALGNEATVVGTVKGVGGLVGQNRNSRSTFKVTNCYNAGAVKGASDTGALCGWSGSSSVFTNCYNVAEAEGASNVMYMVKGSTVKMINCYSMYGLQGKKVTSEQVTDGALCYLLNQDSPENPVWFQNLGTDPHPLPESTHGIVYLVDDRYTNEDPSGIAAVDGTNRVQQIYRTDGVRSTTLRRGLNILRMEDGKVRKVAVK